MEATAVILAKLETIESVVREVRDDQRTQARELGAHETRLCLLEHFTNDQVKPLVRRYPAQLLEDERARGTRSTDAAIDRGDDRLQATKADMSIQQEVAVLAAKWAVAGLGGGGGIAIVAGITKAIGLW